MPYTAAKNNEVKETRAVVASRFTMRNAGGPRVESRASANLPYNDDDAAVAMPMA